MTGVSGHVARLVDDRDQFRCVRCGAFFIVGSRHHRQRRGSGDHTPPNLILLCGTGTTGCHGWVHAHPQRARANGWIVPVENRADPTEIPVLVFPGVWQMLLPDGTTKGIPSSEALELLAVFGLVKTGEVTI
ncbi:HNH endonuclease [Agromyces larvae]|uniref:HNH endonuclease n=1 Tax=Agromyces larvae TaxID=2929802 RepID=A0ABY4C256_9MICO|nr:hypothetical protein [Agromyces larvae]UOE45495.1 hypothetical protein MTO99_06985 [Agromyces larvae]